MLLWSWRRRRAMLLWAAISAGLKVRRLLMPTLSCEIETVIAVPFRFPTPPPPLGDECEV